MEIKHNTSSLSDIVSHFERVKDEFIPPLDSVVRIEEYAAKIYTKAYRIELWIETKLIGLIAFYLNPESKFGFITNVSLEKEFRGKQLARKLMENVIEVSEKNNLDTIKLEVFQKNENAVQFYKKSKFEIIGCNNDYLIMEYKI